MSTLEAKTLATFARYVRLGAALAGATKRKTNRETPLKHNQNEHEEYGPAGSTGFPPK